MRLTTISDAIQVYVMTQLTTRVLFMSLYMTVLSELQGLKIVE